MPCLFAVFEICHRSHSPLCSLFQIPKPTKIQVKIVQLILSPLLEKRPTQRFCLVFRCFSMGRPCLSVLWGGWGAVQMKIGCPKIIESF
jgi:hypothetical protein